MRRHPASWLQLLLIVVLAGVFTLPAGSPGRLDAAQPVAAPGLRTADSEGFVPEEIIIELASVQANQVRGRLDEHSRVMDARTGIESIDLLGQRLGVREIRPVIPAGHRLAAGPEAARLAAFFQVRLGRGQDAIEAASEYRKAAGVRTAQLNYRYTPDLVPNDPQYPNQYAHQVTNAAGGWDIETGTGTNRIVIAPIGVGVQLDHPDLAANIYTNTKEIPGNGIDDDNNGFIDDVNGWDFASNDNNPSPTNDGHETSVAGVAAAVTNNGVGVAGVCWGCRIMPLRIDYSTVEVTQAINYAVANGARVVNMSFGSYTPSKYGPDTTVETAINNGFASGVIMVATAGNDSIDAKRYPGALDNVIDVASTDSTDQRSTFSNYGSWIDVAAPGTSVLSTTLGSGYGAVSGTSFSAPYVAGLAGLILSKNPSLTPATARLMIEYSADHIQPDRFIGSGRVDVAKALALNGPPTLFAIIKSPGNNDLFAAAPINIFGTALGSSYTLEYKPQSSTSWTTVSNGTQTINGTLGILDATGLGTGFYDLRLTAYYGTSQDQSQVSIYVGGNYQVGWPQSAGGYVFNSPIYADLDGDGKQEVIVGADSGLVLVWKQDGTIFPGWPQSMGAVSIRSTAAVGDIDGDGIPEIVDTNVNSSSVYAWHRDGTVVSGFPRDVALNQGDHFWGSVTLANVDADPALEIVVATINGNVGILKGSTGAWVQGWPKAIDSNVQSTPAVGDIDGDGQPEIVVRQFGKLYAFNADGTTVTGWPKSLDPSQVSPVLGDINGDGVVDIVVLEDSSIGITGHVTAFTGSGAQLFRTAFSDSFLNSMLALGDVTGNGRLEIFFGSDSGKVYGVDSQGALLPGWPVSMGAQVSGAPVIADVDGDGQKEIVTASQNDLLYAWNPDGTTALVPISLGAPIGGSPAVADLDADGDVELIAATQGGTVFAFDLAGAWSPGSADWPMFQHDARHSGLSIIDSDNDGDPNPSDCAPLDPAIHHGATEICNFKDDNCNGIIDDGFDVDGDGYTTCNGDCNDLAAQVHPGAPELCNNYDDNCNGLIDEGLDVDGDGYTPCAVPVPDCNDANASIHPGATEVCNNIDDNCNGQIDEGFDQDGDGWTTCALPVGDCNDNDARINGVERSTANASCFDHLDNDCDGVVDWDCAIDVGAATNEVVQYGSVSPKQPTGLANMSAGSANNTYESISETSAGGTKRLSVYWTFANPNPNNWWALRVEAFRATSGDSYTFSVAQRTQAGACGPTTGETYTTAFTVSKTSDDDRLQVYQIGPPNYNTVAFCVHVVDTITSKDTSADTLKIDKLYLMPIILDATADSETTAIGTHVNGTTYLQTQSADGVYEILQEGTGDTLDSTWRFPTVPIGYSHVLHFQGYRPASTGGDDFQFYYATPDPLNPSQPGPFQIITGAVVNTARGQQTSDWAFGPQSTTAPLYGTVWIKVRDTVAGSATLDKLYTDYLVIRATP